MACGAKSGATTSARISPERGIALGLLAVADDLLDGRCDGAHALDLDERDAAFRIPAPEVDGADVGEALALDHGEPGLDQVRRAREVRVQLELLPSRSSSASSLSAWRSSWCTCSTTIVSVSSEAGR